MKNFFSENKFFTFIIKYRWIILSIFILFKIISIVFKIKVEGYNIGHIDGINGEGIYNLFYPLFPLSSKVFPFRSVIHFLWNSCPQFLHDFRNIYFILPAILSMAVAVISYPSNMRMAGTVSLLLSLTILNNHNFDIEQTIIASCTLMAVGSFYAFRKSPQLRIAATTAALCACMHSKGICFPFCLMLFAIFFYESFKQKNIKTVTICFAIFLLGGIAWSLSASVNSGKPVIFTENTDRLIPNLIGGAHGLIQTIEGDVGDTFDLKDATFEQTLMYSIKTVIIHPLKYLMAIVLRIIWLSGKIRYFTLLFILFVCSFFNLKSLKKFPILFMTAAYFFTVYIVMPVEPRYFIPALYLMCSCSAIFLSDCILSLQTKISSKNIVISDEDRNFTIFPLFFKLFSEYTIKISVLLHFAIWVVSIFLLFTFPSRYALFGTEEADKYLKKHPDNIFLAFYPFRNGYPHMRDYDGMLDLYRKTEKNKCPLGVKERWFNFLAGKEEALNDNDPICDKEIYWQDMLLSAFKDIEHGRNKEKGIYDIQTSVLTCMLSSGYIRQDKGTEHLGNTRNLSDNLAISKAGVCAASYEEFIFNLPEKHKKLKHILLNSEAYDMMFPEKVKEMFIYRNSAKCTSCCVSHGGGAPPDKCGITDYKIPHYNQSQRGIVPIYTYNDISSEAIPIWVISIGNVYNKIKATNNKKKRKMLIDASISLLESFLSLYDNEINTKAKESPDMIKISHLKNRPDATYNLAKLYYLKGDKKNARKYLLDTIKYSEGIKVRSEIEKKNLIQFYLKIN